jgi:hypothetical protein
MAKQFRMENGLTWAVKCIAGGATVGRSTPLGDTAGAWQTFDLDFLIPRGCGLVASLELETLTPIEALTGARGRVEFDALSLTKLPY